MKTALLLSGGVDSTALAYWKRPDLCITINYGQLPFEGEGRASREVCRALNIEQLTINVDLASLGSGEMSGTGGLAIAPVPEWWPFRNQLLVTLASIVCVTRSIETLLIGTVVTDAQHADGTGAFIMAMEHLLSIQEGGLKIEAPALTMTSIELIEKVGLPVELFGFCHSCHTSDLACSWCRGCLKFLEVREAIRVRCDAERATS